jgi:hypothetical protein
MSIHLYQINCIIQINLYIDLRKKYHNNITKSLINLLNMHYIFQLKLKAVFKNIMYFCHFINVYVCTYINCLQYYILNYVKLIIFI